MKISPTKAEWNISERQLKLFDYRTIKKTLKAFNNAQGSGSFYMVDYFRKKIIVDSSKALILCGYSENIIEQEGFGFYSRILKQDEQKWILQMNEASYEVYYNHIKSKRKNLAVFYDLTVQTNYNTEVILHHKVVPYKLCKNGNAWLGLCYTKISTSKDVNNKAFFVNNDTKEMYEFINNRFVLSDKQIVNEEDKELLKLLVKGMQDKQMADEFPNVSLEAFKKRKQRLFDKLDVETSAQAIYKAHLLGLI